MNFLKLIKFKKKKEAIIDHIVPLLLCLLVIALVMNILISWEKTLAVKNNADLIIREYILQMEASGYLTDENRKQLEDDLSAIGVTVANWGKTTFSQVGYGNRIVLEVYGVAQSSLLLSEDGESLINDDDSIDIHLLKVSTAKN